MAHAPHSLLGSSLRAWGGWGVICAAGLLAGCSTFRGGAVAKNVINSRQLSLQGLEAAGRKDWDKAEQLFGDAIAACPVDERARAQYAESLWRRNEYAAAIEHMQEAVRLSAGEPNLQVRLGEMHYTQGQFDQARHQAEQALAGNRQLPAAWALLGDVNRAEQKLTESLANYHRALSYQAHYPQVQLAAADIYHQLGREQRSLCTVQALVDQYPAGHAPGDVLMQEGLALKRLGRHDEAVGVLVAASDAGCRTTNLYYELAQSQLLTGDFVNARLAVQQALTQDPHHVASLQLQSELDGRQAELASRRQ